MVPGVAESRLRRHAPGCSRSAGATCVIASDNTPHIGSNESARPARLSFRERDYG